MFIYLSFVWTCVCVCVCVCVYVVRGEDRGDAHRVLGKQKFDL